MGIMNIKDKELFETHKHLYESLVKHSFIRNYTKDVYNDLVHLYTTYVSPKNSFSHWCSSCRAELVQHLYNWYVHYSDNNPVEEPVQEPVQQDVQVDVPIEELVTPKRKRRKQQ